MPPEPQAGPIPPILEPIDKPGDQTSTSVGEYESASDSAVETPIEHLPTATTRKARFGSRLHWFDALIFIALTLFASTIFYGHAGGDLYSDEADYALASTKGFEVNRWDRSDIRSEPDRLIAARHFHAPMTVNLIAMAHRFGAADSTIRMPFIVVGGLAVGLVYLSGLSLFERKREIGVACALLTVISPPMIRMGSHALPWSPIIFELLAILWCLSEYSRSRLWGWIAGVAVAMGALFVTSEVFFVAVPAVLVSCVPLFWPSIRDPAPRREVVRAVGVGAAAFLIIALVVWPSGLTGDALKMLRHYMQMRHSESFPVNVGQQIFLVAPKWSYLYWYWQDYRPFFLCYACGFPALIVLAAVRKLHISVVPLLSLSGFLLFAAHRAHIIGPEYLAHCLPFLSLVAGYALYSIGLIWRPLTTIAVSLLAIVFIRWTPRIPLAGMDVRAQVSRWPAASRFLASRWKPGDKIVVGSQPVSVAHWYLVYQGGAPSIDSQFQTMPIHAPKPLFLERLGHGFYRFVAISNMVEDRVDLNEKTRALLSSWPVIWRSEEHRTGPSRLTIYQAPDALQSHTRDAMPAVSRPPSRKPPH